MDDHRVASAYRDHSHAVFIGIPLVGHLTPLLRQGLELASRGWTVSFATLKGGEKTVSMFVNKFLESEEGHEKDGFNIAVIAKGDCDKALYENVFPRVSRVPYRDGLLPMLSDYVVPMWECTYTSLLDDIQQRVNSVNASHAVVVGDAYTLAAYDIAAGLGMPLVISSADPVYALSDRVLPPDFRLPSMASGQHLHEMGSAFPQRMFHPILKNIIQTGVSFHIEPKLNHARLQNGLKEPMRLRSYMTRKMILVTLPYGYEYPRVMGPLINVVGAMLPSSYPTVTNDEAEWLENSSTPVVFVSMGTIATLTAMQLHEILSALVAGAESSKYRSLWKLSEKQQQELASSLRVSAMDSWLDMKGLSNSIKISKWVSSQQSILQHNAIRGFVSHCGCNSVIEAGAFGVPVVCIPFFADQLDMATRGEDQGVVILVDKYKLRSDVLREAIASTLYPEDTQAQQEALSRVQHLQTLAGGVTRAADLVEHTTWFGADHLATTDTFYPVWQSSNMDIMAAWMLLLATTTLGVLRCIGLGRRSSGELKRKRD